MKMGLSSYSPLHKTHVFSSNWMSLNMRLSILVANTFLVAFLSLELSQFFGESITCHGDSNDYSTPYINSMCLINGTFPIMTHKANQTLNNSLKTQASCTIDISAVGFIKR